MVIKEKYKGKIVTVKGYGKLDLSKETPKSLKEKAKFYPILLNFLDETPTKK